MVTRFIRAVAFTLTVLVEEAGSQVDTTPPIIDVVNVHPFIFHFLVTVNLNEEGTVWCGAILNSGGGTVAPSAVQLKGNLAPLVGHGTSAVAANTHVNIAVAGLLPGTAYDLYCYAEDASFNGLTPASITATKEEGLVTASGGDYVRPTLAYVAPYQLVESTTIRIFVQLNEDGTVWCVAKLDAGSGTTVPTSAEIIGNAGVDSWATGVIVAQNLYKAELPLTGLSEGSTYDVYCFGKDVAGNGIDNTPAFVEDTTAIPATKRAGIATDSTLIASIFRLQSASGVVEYRVEPATWNLQLPNCVFSGTQERRDLESWNAPLTFPEAWLVSHSDHSGRGCTSLPAAPVGFVRLAVVRRGGCSFREKAMRAHLAGYQGLVVIDMQSGALPDMTVQNTDQVAQIPAWILSAADGEALVQAIAASDQPIAAYVSDLRRKPLLGPLQSDAFGARVYATH